MLVQIRRMRNASFILLVFGCASGMGQTNSSPVPNDWLSLPPTQLREVVAKGAAQRKHSADASEVSEATTTSISLSDPETPEFQTGQNHGPLLEHTLASSPESDEALSRRLEAKGYLVRKQPESRNYFVRSVNTMFDTEPMRVGKTTTVTCSLVTAIKKKNPLCLLNPLVLNISW